MRIFGVSEGIIGDQIVALPILNLLENKYPKSYKYWYMSGRTKQAASLYINHPLIDKILVGERSEGLSKEENYLKYNICDSFVEEHPQHQDTQWYNSGRSMMEETFYMRGLEYKKEYGKPQLEKWWGTTPKLEIFFAIWPFAGYSAGLNRSPSIKWWRQFCINLVKKFNQDIIIYHFGHTNEPNIFNPDDYYEKYYERKCNLSFFEQVKLASHMKYNIGTDSGSSHVIGALGCDQVTLLTNWQPNHNPSFPYALAPENWADKNTNLFSKNGCDNIPIDSVLAAIK